jgi:hypothetical protein
LLPPLAVSLLPLFEGGVLLVLVDAVPAFAPLSPLFP